MAVKHSALLRWGLYFSAFVLLTTVTFLNYSLNNYPDSWSLFPDSLYTILARPLFVLGILCVIYPAMLGHAPIVHTILGWYGWTPFAKVTYAAYLVHPVFMNLESYNLDGA